MKRSYNLKTRKTLHDFRGFASRVKHVSKKRPMCNMFLPDSYDLLISKWIQISNSVGLRGPAGVILSLASVAQQQQRATSNETFLLQIDPVRKSNFMLRSRCASASLLAHYVFQPAPPSHIIARDSVPLFLLFFSHPPPTPPPRPYSPFGPSYVFLFFFFLCAGVGLSVNRAFIIIASSRGGWCGGRATGPRMEDKGADHGSLV